MKKKIIALGMALLFAFTLIPTLTVYANQISVTVDGQRVNFEGQPPVNIDGRTLVPVRAVFEHLGFNVGWDTPTQTATITRGNDVIVITIGSAEFTTNGVSHMLDVQAQIISDSTMVPIRLPLESVGYSLNWNGATSTVLITSGVADSDSATTNINPNTNQNTNVQGLPQEQLFGVIQAINGMKLTIDTSQVLGLGGGEHRFSGDSGERERQEAIIRLTEQIAIEVRTSAGGQITGTRAGTLDDLSVQDVVMVEGEWQGDGFVATKLIIFKM